MRVVILTLISLISFAQPGIAQSLRSLKDDQDWKNNINMSRIVSGKLSSRQEGQHLVGRYLITAVAGTGVWTMTVATASLIENGTTNAPREWFEDNALPLARPSIVLASSTVSMLLYERTKLKAFLATIALSSALLLSSHFGGKLLSEEGDALLQWTTTFFLVPLASTLYHHILSSKEESDVKIGRLKLMLLGPGVRKVNGELRPAIGARLGW